MGGPEAAAERRVEKAGSQEGAHPAPPPVGPGLSVSGTRKALDPKRAQEEVAHPRGREEEGEGKETDPPPQAAANGQGTLRPSQGCEKLTRGTQHCNNLVPNAMNVVLLV